MCRAYTRELFKNTERERSWIINKLFNVEAKDIDRRILREREIEEDNAFGN